MKDDLKILIDAVLKWSTMPHSGDGHWGSDFEYAAEHLVPLAQELKETHFSDEGCFKCPDSVAEKSSKSRPGF